MSNLKNYLFTSESVSEGHPDKVSDRISDMVVDSYLSGDPFSRVACETLTTTNKVVLAGEVRGPEIKKDDLIQKVRNCIKDIGYDQEGFTWKEATKIESHLHSQSADIAMGVDSSGNKDEGAGDQGIMFGYACDETDVLMPAPIHYSHKILKLMAEDRKSGKLKNIEPDSKSQVTFEYIDGKPTKVYRSAAYSARHIAKNVVASKIADKCLIQLAYAIGVSKPLSIYVDLFDNDLEKNKFVIEKINENFDLSPRGIREMLNLNKPIYEKTAAYGHFGRNPEDDGAFSWEKTDKTTVFSR